MLKFQVYGSCMFIPCIRMGQLNTICFVCAMSFMIMMTYSVLQDIDNLQKVVAKQKETLYRLNRDVAFTRDYMASTDIIIGKANRLIRSSEKIY